MSFLIILLSALSLPSAFATGEVFRITLNDAEKKAIDVSDLLKSYESEQSAANLEADSRFQTLLPRLSFEGGYQYFGYIPTISLGLGPPFPFGTNTTYQVGPQLSYTLWDTLSGRKSYRASKLLAEAKSADRRDAQSELLASLRGAYVQVQLGLEELRLIHGSMELARAQDRDVQARFRAGAAARLDVVTSGRSVLSYEIQFKARQSELGSSLRELLTYLGDHEARDLSKPGPPSVPDVSLALELEPLEQLLKEESSIQIAEPGNDQPKLQSQQLQSESLDLDAQSQTAKLFPTIQLSASLTYNRPDIPNPPSFTQETVGAQLSMPLYLGDPTGKLASAQRSHAEAARYRVSQLHDDLARDFSKALVMLTSLKDQRVLSAEDVAQSEQEARLYYTSYRAGKINLIDVQNANNQALQAKVNAARIDAQILQQIFTMRSLSGREGDSK